MFINFCQIKDPSISEQLLMDAYDLVQPYMDTNVDKAYKADQYGIINKGQIFWDNASDYRYLILYLFIARMRIIKDYQTCNLKTYTEYKEEFKLDCIKKHFACQSIPFNTEPLFNLFGLGTSSFGFSGIGFMALESDATPVCNETSVFEVQPNTP